MTTQRRKKQSIFPDFPRHTPITDGNGKLTPPWHLSLASLYQALQRNLKNEGFLIPPLTISEQNDILGIYTKLIGRSLNDTNPPTPNISGQMIYSIGEGHLLPPAPGTPAVGYVAPVPKMFIIYFEYPEDPTSTILNASWKTFTVT